AGELRGEAGRATVVHGARARVVAAGLGDGSQVDTDAVRDAAAAVARERVGGTLVWLLDATLPLSPAEQARAVVDGLVLGGYDPGRWKTKAQERRPLDRLLLAGADDRALAGARQAERVAQWTNRARDLVNRPPNDLTPERLAERAYE